MTTTSQVEGDLQAQLELARQVQLRLLPERRCCLSDWEVAFSYESAGFVSGDYVDLIPAGADAFYFCSGRCVGQRSGSVDADVSFACHAADIAAFEKDD